MIGRAWLAAHLRDWADRLHKRPRLVLRPAIEGLGDGRYRVGDVWMEPGSKIAILHDGGLELVGCTIGEADAQMIPPECWVTLRSP